jgi:hypothetical protein
MTKLALLIACFLISDNVFSQTISHEIKQQTDASLIVYKTLELNTSALPVKTVEELKAELIAWKEKVIDITIDTSNQLFILKHNRFMNERELFEVMDKYGITKASILSYK